MKRFTAIIAAIIIAVASSAQTPKNVSYTFTEASDLNLTDEAKKYIKQSGGTNIEMADGVTLEKGATYVMTVTDCTPLDGDNKFNCTIDFRKK